MFDLIFQKVRCKHTSRCRCVLEVAEVDLVGYVVLSMVLGLGTLESGSDDVPRVLVRCVWSSPVSLD